jgi:hypothetical protein
MVYRMDAPELSHLKKSGTWLDDTKSLDKVMLTVPSLLPDVERRKSMVLWESTKKDEEGLAAFLIDDVIRGNNVLLPLIKLAKFPAFNRWELHKLNVSKERHSLTTRHSSSSKAFSPSRSKRIRIEDQSLEVSAGPSFESCTSL